MGLPAASKNFFMRKSNRGTTVTADNRAMPPAHAAAIQAALASVQSFSEEVSSFLAPCWVGWGGVGELMEKTNDPPSLILPPVPPKNEPLALVNTKKMLTKNVTKLAKGRTNKASVAPFLRRRMSVRRIKNIKPAAKPVSTGLINQEHTIGTTPL